MSVGRRRRVRSQRDRQTPRQHERRHAEWNGDEINHMVEAVLATRWGDSGGMQNDERHVGWLECKCILKKEELLLLASAKFTGTACVYRNNDHDQFIQKAHTKSI